MQRKLWHDSLDGALRDAADSAGPKAVASLLWPEKDIEDATRYLHRCLDPERAEKLSISQIVLVMREGKKADCHTPMAYLSEILGYEPPKPANPETERDRVQREFIRAQEEMQQLVARMERLREAG